jgi:hypothetical protein
MPIHTWNSFTGEWEEKKPLPAEGWKARLEWWFHSKSMDRLAKFMGSWDERGLGK